MKKTTLFVMLCLISLVLQAQINLSQNFENGAQGWDTNTFFFSSLNACSGTSGRKNIFSTATSGDIQSPNIIGLSNGNDISISMDYKIVDWGFGTVATDPGWGNFDIQYSTNDGSSWVTVATIDDSNHITSNQCANLSYNVLGSNIPSGSDFKFRLNATWADGDYYLYIDDISINQATSQSPPVNDDVEDATMLDVGAVYDDYRVDSTVQGATMDNESAGCGVDGPGIWYKAVVPSNGALIVETGADSGANSGFDSVIEVFSGPINNLVSLGCNDESDNTEFNYSQLELLSLTPGETVYIRVWEDGGNEAEPFAISAFSDTLSIQESDLEQVKLFPNPVNDVLNVHTISNIDSLIIYTVLGRNVLRVSNVSTGTQINASDLKPGAYIAVISIGQSKKTIKLIKE